jgi:hypothetical protein
LVASKRIIIALGEAGQGKYRILNIPLPFILKDA